MAPLGNAMCLIDSNKADVAMRNKLEKAVRHDFFRRQIQ